MNKRAEVAGAGFAGLAAATALAQQGWSVRVHERADEVRAFGAGIWIWENGIRVLDALGAADDAFEGHHAAPEFRNWDEHGNRLYDTTFPAEDSQAGSRVFCVVRQHLLMALLNAAKRAGVEVETKSRVIGATPEGELLVEGGKSFKADLVIGADGVGSRVRDSLRLLKTRKRHVDGAIRVLIPHEPGFAETKEGRQLREWWVGSRRVLYTPCNSESYYLCFSALITDEAGSRMPLDKAEWKRSFPMIASMIDKVGDENRYDVFETTKLHRWSKGKVAIVGDAAHSMTPGLGQGCGTALVNALSLARTIRDTPTLDEAFERWERMNRPLTEHTQFWSAITWPKSRWPTWLLRIYFHLPIWSQWSAGQRLIPALNIPYSTENRPRWIPPAFRG